MNFGYRPVTFQPIAT